MSKNRLIGGTFLVAGTTIGAGMLALPITIYNLGFTWGVVLLSLMWLFMYYAAVITANINVHHGKGFTIASLARKAFGPKGEIVASFSLLFLFYALLTAYTVGGASVLGSILQSNFGINISSQFCMVIFTLVFGGIVTTTMTGMDYLNRLLFILKTGAFGGMALWLLPKVSPTLLTTSEAQGTFQAWHMAIPIVFTAFGFHGSIPSLMNYLGMNRKHLKIVFLVGSLIPLMVYILWLAITIGTIPPETFSAIIAKGGDLGSLVTALNEASGSKGISVFTDLFAGIGVITSYLGVGIGVMDFYKERLEDSATKQKIIPRFLIGLFILAILFAIEISLQDRTIFKDSADFGIFLEIIFWLFLAFLFFIKDVKYRSGVMTFLIPLCISTTYPQGFIAALGYAAIALSMLAVILPALIALKLKKEGQHTIPFNLYLLLAAGIGILVLEILHIAKVF